MKYLTYSSHQGVPDFARFQIYFCRFFKISLSFREVVFRVGDIGYLQMSFTSLFVILLLAID